MTKFKAGERVRVTGIEGTWTNGVGTIVPSGGIRFEDFDYCDSSDFHCIDKSWNVERLFKAGVRVQRVNGETFSNGERVVTVMDTPPEYRKYSWASHKVWFKETQTNLSPEGIELVSEYKTVAEMTDEELGALVRAFREGKTIEYYSRVRGGWYPVAEPGWYVDAAYRVKHKPVITEKTFEVYSVTAGTKPNVAEQLFDPTHRITYVWEDDKLIDVKLSEV